MKKFYFLPPFITQTLVWIPIRLTLWFFAHFEVRGFENIRQLPRGIIFANNHGSELDPIIIPASLPFLSRFSPIFYTSREKSFYKKSGWRQRFYGGTFFKILGAYSVHAGKHDYELSLKDHVNFLKNKMSICIFPEGRKTTDGTIKEAHGGVAYLALQSSVPIVPVAIVGSYQMTLWEFLRRTRKISVIFGKPIFPNEIFKDLQTVTPTVEDYKAAAKMVMWRVHELILQVRL